MSSAGCWTSATTTAATPSATSTRPRTRATCPPPRASSGARPAANRYLKRILYGNDTPYLPAQDAALPTEWCFQVVLDYGEHDASAPTPAEDASWPCRPDPFSTYRAGFEVRTYRACQRILMFHQFPGELGAARCRGALHRPHLLPAEPAALIRALPVYSQLSSVTQTGWVAAAAGTGYQTAQLPPLDFRYSPLALDDTLQAAGPDASPTCPAISTAPADAGSTWTGRDCRGS